MNVIVLEPGMRLVRINGDIAIYGPKSIDGFIAVEVPVMIVNADGARQHHIEEALKSQPAQPEEEME